VCSSGFWPGAGERQGRRGKGQQVRDPCRRGHERPLDPRSSTSGRQPAPQRAEVSTRRGLLGERTRLRLPDEQPTTRSAPRAEWTLLRLPDEQPTTRSASRAEWTLVRLPDEQPTTRSASRAEWTRLRLPDEQPTTRPASRAEWTLVRLPDEQPTTRPGPATRVVGSSSTRSGPTPYPAAVDVRRARRRGSGGPSRLVRRGRLGSPALDRLLRAPDRDLDPARRALLGLGDADLEDAPVERGSDRLRVDAFGQRQAARTRWRGGRSPAAGGRHGCGPATRSHASPSTRAPRARSARGSARGRRRDACPAPCGTARGRRRSAARTRRERRRGTRRARRGARARDGR
jgi:hypothetical protein